MRNYAFNIERTFYQYSTESSVGGYSIYTDVQIAGAVLERLISNYLTWGDVVILARTQLELVLEKDTARS